MKIGIDLGTTNTVVSTYKNGEVVKLSKFEDLLGNTSSIFPSLLLENLKNRYSYIGFDAKSTFYDFYKNDPEELANFQLNLEYKRYIEKNPKSIEITTLIIDHIIRKIQGDNNTVGDEIEGIVATVPHSWKPDSLQRLNTLKAVENNSFGIKLLRLVSEPIAASAFFAFKRDDKVNETVMICDIGGGTQDYSLCEIDTSNFMNVIDNSGTVESGGAIIDEEISEFIVNNLMGLKSSLTDNDKLFIKLLSEEIKINLNNRIIRQINLEHGDNISFWRKISKSIKNSFNTVKEYFEKKQKETIQFKDKKIELLAQNLIIMSQPLIKIMIEQIEKLLSKNTNNYPSKAILVGGGSKNILIESALRDFLASKNIELKKFTSDEMYLCISYGASLIANDIIKYQEKTRFNYGLLVKNSIGELKPYSLLPINTLYNNLVFSQNEFRTINQGENSLPIIKWYNDINDYNVICDKFTVKENLGSHVKFGMQINNSGILEVGCYDSNSRKITEIKLNL